MSRVSSASVKTHAIDGFFAKYPTPTDAMQSDPAHAFEILKPLGLFANRWKGVRPTVRGVAMNPIDHPHGGGEGKSSGGRSSVTP